MNNLDPSSTQNASNELMQSIIDATGDLIFVKDINFVYLAGNKAFEKFIGRPLAQIIGHTDDDWFPDKETVDYFRNWDRQLFSSGETQDVEEWVSYPDGSKVLLHTIKYPIYRDNKVIGLVGVSRNITAQRRAEELNNKTLKIIEMLALGKPSQEIYDAIVSLYESRHSGMRCSLLTLSHGQLMHGSAPNLPQEYCNAIHGLENGLDNESYGAALYAGKRCLVENIETNPKWAALKESALPHGIQCCWSEPIKSSNGEVLGAFGMHYNHTALPNEDEISDLESAAQLAGVIIERERDQKRLKALAYFDFLTGLATRANFFQFVEGLIKNNERYKRQFSILYLDLDNFKEINDTFGHDAGDLLLQEIARRLKSASRETDFVARLGGDEFCIVLVEPESAADTEIIAQRCFNKIQSTIMIAGKPYHPACSIGISSFPSDGTTISELLKAADIALYQAKSLGKSQVVKFDPT